MSLLGTVCRTAVEECEKAPKRLRVDAWRTKTAADGAEAASSAGAASSTWPGAIDVADSMPPQPADAPGAARPADAPDAAQLADAPDAKGAGAAADAGGARLHPVD
eukprot:7404570-Pyramimonas_sp.AAC.1